MAYEIRMFFEMVGSLSTPTPSASSSIKLREHNDFIDSWHA